MKNNKIKQFHLVVGAIIIIPLLLILGVPLYFRISGDIQVCQKYYSEMGLMQCYFSSKTVRVPGGFK